MSENQNWLAGSRAFSEGARALAGGANMKNYKEPEQEPEPLKLEWSKKKL